MPSRARTERVGDMGQVITANRLADGTVVFFGPDASWVERIGQAEIFAGASEAAAGLAISRKAEDTNFVLDVYAIEVAEKNGIVTPVRLREAIRATGPTIHPEHGKGSDAAKRG